MTVALVIIATNPQYWAYAKTFIASVREFFIPCDVIAFTDSPNSLGADHQFQIPTYDWNKATLLRYQTVMSQRDFLAKYDYVFYSDVDMRFCGKVTEQEILSNGLTVTEHPSYIGVPGPQCDFEFGSGSTASLTEEERKRATYYCGGFNGGTSESYLELARVCCGNIATDMANGVRARWTDESHINKYLVNHPPAKVLTIAFCWPDQQWRIGRLHKIWDQARGANWYKTVVPKLLAVEKTGAVDPSHETPTGAVRRLKLMREQRADAKKGIHWKLEDRL